MAAAHLLAVVAEDGDRELSEARACLLQVQSMVPGCLQASSLHLAAAVDKFRRGGVLAHEDVQGEEELIHEPDGQDWQSYVQDPSLLSGFAFAGANFQAPNSETESLHPKP